MLEPEELIDKFYQSIKDKYPQLDIKAITIICQAPFIFLREQMAKIILPQIRFKYWGVYKVKDGRLKALPKIIDNIENNPTANRRNLERMKEIQKLKSDK